LFLDAETVPLGETSQVVHPLWPSAAPFVTAGEEDPSRPSVILRFDMGAGAVLAVFAERDYPRSQ
jgi:hypothetical protein